MEAKELTLMIPGATHDAHRTVIIGPSTTAADLLAQQSLQDYILSAGTGKPFIAAQDNLFPLVEPGGKIYATTIARQGA